MDQDYGISRMTLSLAINPLGLSRCSWYTRWRWWERIGGPVSATPSKLSNSQSSVCGVAEDAQLTPNGSSIALEGTPKSMLEKHWTRWWFCSVLKICKSQLFRVVDPAKAATWWFRSETNQKTKRVSLSEGRPEPLRLLPDRHTFHRRTCLNAAVHRNTGTTTAGLPPPLIVE